MILKQIRFKYEFVSVEAAAPPAPAEPTHEEKLQQQLAEQLQLPGLDTSAPLPRQPVLEQAKVCALLDQKCKESVVIFIFNITNTTHLYSITI